jgi:hypothetical protein
VLEHRAPFGDTPPLHIHHTEDEIFEILDGEFWFKIGDHEYKHSQGDIFLLPRGIPHSYLVESRGGGHWITITSKGDFERFVMAISRVATRPVLPEPKGKPSPEEMEQFAKTAGLYNIELVGPPLHE